MVAADVPTEHATEYLRRCAWCERTLITGNWLEERDLPPVARAHAIATHTICPRCVEELRRDGKSI